MWAHSKAEMESVYILEAPELFVRKDSLEMRWEGSDSVLSVRFLSTVEELVLTEFTFYFTS